MGIEEARKALEDWLRDEKFESHFSAADELLLNHAPTILQALAASQPISDAAVREWAERYDIKTSLSELRCMIEDAQTLALAAAPPAPEESQ